MELSTAYRLPHCFLPTNGSTAQKETAVGLTWDEICEHHENLERLSASVLLLLVRIRILCPPA